MTDTLLALVAIALLYCMVVVTAMARELRALREADEHATAPAEGWDAVRRCEERRHDL